MSKLWTGYYAQHHDNPTAVAISVGVPVWFRGRTYPALAPDRAWLDLPREEYVPRYEARLEALDAQTVVDDLGEAIMLCWERPPKFCHRRLVAKWIQAETGIVVPEMTAQPALPEALRDG
jgi:hypothetical protein